MSSSLFIHSAIEGCFGCFMCLKMMNRIATKILVLSPTSAVVAHPPPALPLWHVDCLLRTCSWRHLMEWDNLELGRKCPGISAPRHPVTLLSGSVGDPRSCRDLCSQGSKSHSPRSADPSLRTVLRSDSEVHFMEPCAHSWLPPLPLSFSIMFFYAQRNQRSSQLCLSVSQPQFPCLWSGNYNRIIN